MPIPPASRVPPGQRLITDFPILQAGSVMHVGRSAWKLSLSGLVSPTLELDYEALLALPATEQVSDIHCVTGWTKLDTRWKGVKITGLLEQVEVGPEARHVVVHSTGGWTTNLPLEELTLDDVLLAYEYEGSAISDEHGGPVRLVVPRLYFWKSAKWIRGIEFTVDERLGYWERVGYHRLGDPWLEQRYS
jgi:DMSO/TMAO reductase YedYZ molybdopterin-dependent catalytic subunit